MLTITKKFTSGPFSISEKRGWKDTTFGILYCELDCRVPGETAHELGFNTWTRLPHQKFLFEETSQKPTLGSNLLSLHIPPRPAVHLCRCISVKFSPKMKKKKNRPVQVSSSKLLHLRTLSATSEVAWSPPYPTTQFPDTKAPLFGAWYPCTSYLFSRGHGEMNTTMGTLFQASLGVPNKGSFHLGACEIEVVWKVSYKIRGDKREEFTIPLSDGFFILWVCFCKRSCWSVGWAWGVGKEDGYNKKTCFFFSNSNFLKSWFLEHFSTDSKALCYNGLYRL